MANNSDEQLAAMSIFDVVKLPGGNGLASPPFQTPLNFLGIFGWQHVDDGVEALVCEGRMIQSTHYGSDAMRLFGRRRLVRRVLLRPAPLTNLQAKALTSDKLDLTLTVSLNYEVSNPLNIATRQDPLAELSNRVTGEIAEYIRTQTFDDIISDDGRLRVKLRQRLMESPTIQAAFKVVEVLKALPSGDERLIEAARKARLAKAEQGLIEQTGANKLIEAQYHGQIVRGQAELDDEMARRKHERDMELEKLQAQAQLAQQAIATLGSVATAGMDPSKLLNEFMGIVTGRSTSTQSESQSHQLTAGHPPVSSGNDAVKAEASNRAAIEREGLASVKDSLDIVSFEIFESNGHIKGALIQMTNYEIVFTCEENYPTTAPKVTVRFPNGEAMQPVLPWVPKFSNLAQAVVAVVLQLKGG